MIKTSKQIVCISTHYWNDAWFRKQHFMSRLAEDGYKVAYIEPSIPILKNPDKDKIGYQTNRYMKVVVEKISDNLCIIKPPRFMRFATNPVMSKLNHMYLSYRISHALKQLNFKDYILWIYQHQYAPGLKFFKYGKLVYDITDDLPAYKQSEPAKYNYIKNCTDQIVEKSNLVIVTASSLLDKYKDVARNITLVPNGYDSSLFSDEIKDIPDDLKGIKGPIVGFIGTLFSFLDYELLEFIIKNNPDKSFVFIGNCEKTCEEDWNNITGKYSNVFWLGKKKKEDIPFYINAFDVCINPFKVDDVSKSVSPLKVFEYLAMKKPVVSVKMESLEKEEVAPFIYFATSYDDFNKKLDVALNDNDIFQKESYYQVINKYSWNSLFEKANNSIKSL